MRGNGAGDHAILAVSPLRWIGLRFRSAAEDALQQALHRGLLLLLLAARSRRTIARALLCTGSSELEFWSWRGSSSSGTSSLWSMLVITSQAHSRSARVATGRAGELPAHAVALDPLMNLQHSIGRSDRPERENSGARRHPRRLQRRVCSRCRRGSAALRARRSWVTAAGWQAPRPRRWAAAAAARTPWRSRARSAAGPR